MMENVSLHNFNPGDLDEKFNVSLHNFNPGDLDEKFLSISYKTGFLSDGRQRAVRDYLVRSTHTNNFLITIPSATSFVLKTRVPQLFLDAMGRAVSEFDPNHHDTYVLIAGMRETVDVITEDQGSDFNNMWSNGVQYQLPFKCNPNPNVQLIWLTGCVKLLNKRTYERGAPDAVHQQMRILRVMFTSQEMQRVAGVRTIMSWVIVVPHPHPGAIDYGRHFVLGLGLGLGWHNKRSWL